MMFRALALVLVGLAGAARADTVLNGCDDPKLWEGVATLDTTLVREGRGSLRWDWAKGGSLLTRTIPHDWSGANALSFWLHSAVATGSPFHLILSSEDAQSPGMDYYLITLRANFTGWRHFVVPFSEIGVTRKPVGWKQIDYLQFHNAWNPSAKPDPRTVLTINGLKLTTVGDSGHGPRLSDEDFYAGLDLTRPELAAVKAAVDRGDYAAAGHAWAEHLRARRSPKWLQNHWERPQPDAKYDTAAADRALAHQFKMINTPWQAGPRIDWSYNAMTQGESATIEWNAQLNRHFHFRALVDAYWRTGQDKYAKELADQMVAWIEDCPVLLSQSGNGPYHHAWETLNTAIRLNDTWPDALFRCLDSPGFTDAALVKISKSLVEHAEHLVQWPSKANWLTAESTGVFYTGLLFPEFQRAADWRQIGIERLYRQLDEEVYPDGLENELALGYNNWVVSEFSQVLKLTSLNQQAGDVPADYLSKLERMYHYQLYAQMPNRRVPGLNDAGASADPQKLLEDGAAYFPARADFKWAATRGKEGSKPTAGSVAFPYSGHYVMRSGWDPQDRYLLFDAGPYGTGHQHEDKLGILAYAYRKMLLVEGGVFMYDASRWRRYVLSTRAHNTLRVDGADQRTAAYREDWALAYPFQPLPNPWVSRPEYDYVAGTYTRGYGTREQETAAVTHRRSIVFVKPDYWLVTDTLTPADAKEHEYEALFHLNAKAATADGLAVATAEPDANLRIVPTPVPGLRVEVVKGREEEPVQGWADSPWRAVPTAVYHWRATGPTQVTWVLYPTGAGQACPVAEVTALPAGAEVRFADGTRQRLGGETADARATLITLDAQGKETRRLTVPKAP